MKIKKNSWFFGDDNIHKDVDFGSHWSIGSHRVIKEFDDFKRIKFGDCCRIGDDVKILCDDLEVGDYAVIHDGTRIIGPGPVRIGHNFWCGQNCYFDARAEIEIEDDVRIGKNANVWTHVAAGELLEGSLFCDFKKTRIRQMAWLVGDNIHVSPGVTIHWKSIILPHSVVTENTEPLLVYGGTPAKPVDVIGWGRISVDEKMEMMLKFAREFIEQKGGELKVFNEGKCLIIKRDGQSLLFGIHPKPEVSKPNVTYFHMTTKTYTKKLTDLEIEFMRWAIGYRARFIPEEKTE